MEYRTLGNTGLKVSVLSYGSWVSFKQQVDENLAYKLMKAAFLAGVNLFDNAEGYAYGESERIMGESVKQGISEGVWSRSDLVLTTKIFFGYKKTPGPNDVGLSRKHIIEGINASLDRMKLDYVDVVFCHRPDPLTPIEEIVRAMNYVINQGKAHYWGTSEWSSQAITSANLVAQRLGLIGPCCEQPEYNIFERTRVEVEYDPLYNEFGLGLTTWSPLASGILTGKYIGKNIPQGSRLSLPEMAWLRNQKMKESPQQFEQAEKLLKIAEEIGCTLTQLAIGWCIRNPRVSTCLLGATSLTQLEENLQSIKVVPKLTKEVLKKIDQIVPPPTLPRVTRQVNSVRQVTRQSRL